MSSRALTWNRDERPLTLKEPNMRHFLVSILLLFLAPAIYAQTPTLGLNAPQLYEKGMNSLWGLGLAAMI